MNHEIIISDPYSSRLGCFGHDIRREGRRNARITRQCPHLTTEKPNMATDFKTLFNLVIVLGLGVGVNALTHYPPGKVSISRSVLLEEDN